MLGPIAEGSGDADWKVGVWIMADATQHYKQQSSGVSEVKGGHLTKQRAGDIKDERTLVGRLVAILLIRR